jgi:hypothetical protein
MEARRRDLETELNRITAEADEAVMRITPTHPSPLEGEGKGGGADSR